jgi:hypothetical protein
MLKKFLEYFKVIQKDIFIIIYLSKNRDVVHCCSGGTVVEHISPNPKIKGSNRAAGRYLRQYF